MNKEIYIKQYEYELEQRNHLASKVNIPLMGITILGSALCTMAIKFQYSGKFESIFFIFFSITSLVTLIVSLYYVFRSLLGYKYHTISPFSDIEKHKEKLKKWYAKKNIEESEIEHLINNDINSSFYKRLSSAADHNGKNNRSRAEYLYKSTLSLSFVVVILAICGAIFVYDAISSTGEVHKITIIGDVQLTEKSNMPDTDDDNNEEETNQQVEQEEEKPEFPQNVESRDYGADIETKKGGK